MGSMTGLTIPDNITSVIPYIDGDMNKVPDIKVTRRKVTPGRTFALRIRVSVPSVKILEL